MGFPKQEFQSSLPFPPPGDLPDPEIEPMSPTSPALAGGFVTIKHPGAWDYPEFINILRKVVCPDSS